MSIGLELAPLAMAGGAISRAPDAEASDGVEPPPIPRGPLPRAETDLAPSQEVGEAAGQRQRRALEAVEAQRTAARRAAREHLPSPAEAAKEIALALFEVEAGRRSAAQLERVFSPELWDLLEHQVQRRGGPLPSSGDLLRVHFQELDPGLANTVAVIQRGPRVQPVAMRLDACSGRWLVTELRY
jgi:hypothetical protein